VLAVDPDRAEALADLLTQEGEQVIRLGEVVAGGGVAYKGTLK